LEDDDSTVVSQPQNTNTITPRWQRVLERTIVPDEAFQFRGIRILDGKESLRFIKFALWTFFGIVMMHWFVALLKWERDHDYSIADMILYDSSSIIIDIMSFYMVGRLFKKRGVDHLSWMAISLLGAFYMSAESKFKFLRYSVSLFEMHCVWPWTLWLFVAILIPLICVIVVKHVQYAVDRGLLVVKLVELTLSIVVCLVPVVSDPNFHFHHW